MISYEKTFNDCLKKMFKYVDLEYPNPEFVKQDNWYDKKTWTEKDRTEFKTWMEKLLKKRYPSMSRRGIDLEVGVFMLSYGWSCSKDLPNKPKNHHKMKVKHS